MSTATFPHVFNMPATILERIVAIHVAHYTDAMGGALEGVSFTHTPATRHDEPVRVTIACTDGKILVEEVAEFKTDFYGAFTCGDKFQATISASGVRAIALLVKDMRKELKRKFSEAHVTMGFIRRDSDAPEFKNAPRNVDGSLYLSHATIQAAGHSTVNVALIDRMFPAYEHAAFDRQYEKTRSDNTLTFCINLNNMAKLADIWKSKTPATEGIRCTWYRGLVCEPINLSKFPACIVKARALIMPMTVLT